MAKKENIVRYTAAEVQEMLAREGDRTDYDREVSQEEIEQQIASDPDLAVPENWKDLVVEGIPLRQNKRLVSVRYTPRVIDYFKSTGKGWQARMDAVLAAFVDQQQRPQR